MQNQWVGDSADFGKYGLLRALCCPQPEDEYRGLKLGVVWYLNPDDAPDPKKEKAATAAKVAKDERSYLDATVEANLWLYRDCDRALYDRLRKATAAPNSPNSPDIETIQASSVLPRTTTFYSPPVPKDPDERTAWAEDAVAQTQAAKCGLVYLDPDTGMNQKPTTHDARLKNARLDELRPYLCGGQSLVVYQNSKYDGPMVRQVRRKKDELGAEFGLPTFAMVYGRYRGGGWVVFFVIAAEGHRERLFTRAEGMVNGKGRWGEHFLMVGQRGRH